MGFIKAEQVERLADKIPQDDGSSFRESCENPFDQRITIMVIYSLLYLCSVGRVRIWSSPVRE
jgi:hypothetical protein